MDEIKAYIKPENADKVIFRLEITKAEGLIVIDVSTLRGFADQNNPQISVKLSEKYDSNVKTELDCPDEEDQKFVNIFLDKVHTEEKRENKIFASDIIEAYSNRPKKQQEEAL